MDFCEEYWDGNDTFYNTVDSAFFHKHYRLWLSRYGGKSVSCSMCPPHGGENYNSGYHNKRSWKKWRKFQCKSMASRGSVRDAWDTEDLEDEERWLNG